MKASPIPAARAPEPTRLSEVPTCAVAAAATRSTPAAAAPAVQGR